MSAKNLQLNLLFNADTTNAQQNIQQLSKLLHQISDTKIGFNSGALSQAAKDAQALSGHLANAVNVNTGKLDLSKLNSSLTRAKTDLNSLTSSLQAAGPAGQQAFLKIAAAISQAEAPTMRMSASMKNLLTTLGNTVKWQIASSAIHGLTGAISESISYIEKFDKALTDIKIVSDLNNEQLLTYAQNTRRIAKELNATSLEIAQGSTLYFQQGLSEAEVEKRIKVTQKLANVTGETSATVTSQMTSIWNNFADGTKTLESFADKLAYLGASTAADTNQIATAMEKFAASAKEVGLSYDLAATAIAEVVDRTQMAPEEVGTAFKTILSRLQGLKLGETLEDGVDLNKYGEALEVVGVKVLDANNELRNADDILKDLGRTWDTLDQAQKKALATTVAGLRQQTQFMALMGEWDDIEVSVLELSNATGYLNQQNEEWSDSIQGIKKRYEETKDTLFKTILSEDTLKGFYTSMEGVLGTVTKIVDAMGGLGPMVLTIAALFSRSLIPAMTSGIANMVANIQMAFGVTESKTKQIRADFEKQIQIKLDSGQLDVYQEKQLRVSQMIMREKERLLEISKSASAIEKEQINNQIALLETQGASVQKAYEEAAILERQLKIISSQVVEATKKQNALNNATFNFKQNSTSSWNKEEADIIGNMATSDTSAIRARKNELNNSMSSIQKDIDVETGKKQSLQDDIALDKMRLAARQRQATAIQALQNGNTAVTHNQATNTLKSQLPPELAGQSGTYSYVVDDKKTVMADILALQEKIAANEKELNNLESDTSPLNVKKEELQAAEKELAMLEEAERLKRKANSAAVTMNKDTIIEGGEQYGLLSVKDTGDSQTGTDIASKAISSVDGMKLTTDKETGERSVNTDTKSSIANYEALKKKQGELVATSEKLKRGTQDITAVTKTLKSAQDQAADAVAKHGKESKTAQRAQSQYEKTLKQTKQSAKDFATELTNSLKSVKGDAAEAEIKQINAALEQIEATDDVKEIETAFKQLISITDQLGTEFQQAAGIVGGAAETMANNIAGNSDEAKAKLATLGDTAMQEGIQMQQAGQQFDQFGKVLKNNENAPVSWSAKLSGTVSSMARFAGSCQMALSGLQVFMNAFEENASPMERFTSIMSGLSMLLPVVATAIGLVDVAQKAQTTSTIAATIAKWAENAAWYASPVLWIPIAIMAVVAAIAGLITWIVKLTQAQNKDAIAAKKAAENAEKMAEAHEAAKQELEDIKSAFDAYDTAVAALEECTKGTKAWEEALKNVNEVALDLLQQYPELAKEADLFKRNSEGMLVINEDKKNSLIEAAENKVTLTQSASLMASARASEAQVKADKTDFSKNVGSMYGVGQATSSQYGTTYEQYLDMGKILSENATALADLTEKEYRQKLEELIRKATDDQIENSSNFDSQMNSIIDRCMQYQGDVDSLAQNTEEAANQISQASQLIVDQVLGNTFDAAEKTIAAGAYQEEYQKIYNDIIKQDQKNAQSDSNTKISKDIWARFNKAQGTNLTASDNQIQGDDNNRVYAFKGKNGEETYTIEYIAETIAASEALAKITGNADLAAEALSKMDNKIREKGGDFEAESGAMRGFIANKNFEGMNVGDIESFYAEVAKGNPDGVDTGDISKADVGWYLDKMLGDGKDGKISDTTAEKYFGMSADEAVDKFYNELTGAFDSVEAFDLPKSLISVDSLNFETAKKVSDVLSTIEAGPMGEKVGTQFVNGINDMIEGLDSEQQSAALNKLMEIDWTSWDAMEQADAVMKEFGVNIDTSSDKWIKFANNMRQATGAMPDFSKLKTDLNEITAILQDLNFGDVISEEDYQRLVKYNDEWERFFILQADGTRKFMGDSSEMLDLTRSNIRASKEDALHRKQIADNIKNSGLDYDFSEKHLYAKNGGDGDDGAFSDSHAESKGYLDGDDMMRQVKKEAVRKFVINSEDAKQLFSDQGYTMEEIAQIYNEAVMQGDTTRLDEMISTFDSYMAQDYEAITNELNEMLASTATTFDELDEMLHNGEIDLQSYTKAWQNLSQQEKLGDLDSKEVQQYTKHLQKSAKEVDNLSDELETNAEAAETVAIYTMKMNKGIDKLADGFDDWKSVLTKSSKASEEYSDAMTDIKDAMSDVLGVSEEFISDDFITENLDLISQAATGSAEAIDQLAIAASEDILINILIDNNSLGVNWEYSLNLLNDMVNSAEFEDIEVGATLDTGEFLENANSIVSAAEMTVAEAQALYNSLGFEPEFVMQNEVRTAPMYGTRVYTDDPVMGTVDVGDGTKYPYIKSMTTHEEQVYMGEKEQNFVVPAMSANGTPIIKSFTKKSSGKMNNYSSSNRGGKSPGGSGGGGGSKKAPKIEKPKYKTDDDRTKVEDEIQRYYKITNKIEDLSRELDKLSNAKDDAWGPDKLAAMDKEIAKLKQVRAANKQYRDEIAQNLTKDRQKVEGHGVKIGADGIVSNYEEIITQWAKEKDAVTVDEYNSYEDQIVALRNQANAIDSEADEDGSQKQGLEDQITALEDERDQKVKAAEDLYDSRMEALGQYEETRDLLADTNAELEEQLRQIQQLNYEKLMYKVEYKIEVNDSELNLLEKKLERIEKTIFKDAEAFSLIQKNVDQQYKILVDGEGNGRNPYDLYSNQYKELQELYELGKTDPENGINQDQFMQGLSETMDGLSEAYDTIVAMDEKMQEYYGNAIEDGLELIHTYEEGFDGLLSTLDHYSNVMTLIGQEKNYEGMNMILEGRVEVLNDRIESAERTITDLEASKALIEAELAKPDIHPDTKAFWEEQLQTINGALRDEQDALYGYIEEVGDAANQILKNNIDKAMKELRDSITGGVNLEYLMKDMERISTYQEDYLTNTNKMYETNKILSQAQLAIDKTSNAQAKQKYKEYIKYVEQLQTTEKLSKQELSVAQAKYAILEAEIALEEAKNAKSEVRLTRDSEGNFGYVYTADQDNIASATQTYLDKQNELYNISLEGSKQYREKYLENIQNMLDEVEALEYAYLVDHSITQEEYEKQKLSIQEYYGEQGKSYASLFNAAQWELASSSYSTLMEENTIFNNAQLSANKEHQNAMAYNDAEYIGGLKDNMSGMHASLEEDLRYFNMNSYDETDTNYVKTLARDQKYYTDLEKEAEQAQAYIYGQMTNPSANSAAHHMNEFATTTGKAFDSCESAATDWENMIKPLNERVGKSFSGDESNEGLAQKVKEVTDESEALRKKLNDKDGLHDTISTTWIKAHNMTAEWEVHRAKINEVKDSYFYLMTQIQNTMTAMANFNGANAPDTVSSDDIPAEYTTVPSSSGETGNTANEGTGTSNADPTNDGELNVGDMVTYTGGTYYSSSYGDSPTGNRGPGGTVKVTDIKDGRAYPIHVYSTDSAYGWLKKSQLSGYDTGGYTGEWGPEGKIALLHQKELVLNKQDTENFLTATQILREISQMLDANALVASLGAINLSAMNINGAADQILQQEVTIHADFPNVTDHNEIEMAIDNLINAASQYANRK